MFRNLNSSYVKSSNSSNSSNSNKPIDTYKQFMNECSYESSNYEKTCGGMISSGTQYTSSYTTQPYTNIGAYSQCSK